VILADEFKPDFWIATVTAIPVLLLGLAFSVNVGRLYASAQTAWAWPPKWAIRPGDDEAPPSKWTVVLLALAYVMVRLTPPLGLAAVFVAFVAIAQRSDHLLEYVVVWVALGTLSLALTVVAFASWRLGWLANQFNPRE
jgi:hypothetical protein